MKDLTNECFGKLKVIKFYDTFIDLKGRKRRRWLCECDCKEENKNAVIVRESNLKSGNTKSCGCIQRETRSKNGKTNKQYNTYDLTGEYGIGYTSKGEEFYFDLEDYDKIKDYLWHIDKKGYVESSTEKTHYLKMHRFVLGLTNPNDQVDHIKHNKRDNRKSMMRVVTNSQNKMNTDVPKNSTTGYKGVNFIKSSNKYSARIQVNKKQFHLGYFTDINDAIKARKDAEEKYFGEFSYTNSMKVKETYARCD